MIFSIIDKNASHKREPYMCYITVNYTQFIQLLSKCEAVELFVAILCIVRWFNLIL